MLKLYNTLTRTKQEFKPLEGNKVGLYTCGPTVYDFAHIGNLKTYIFSDILKRALLASGFEVTHIMNITDVGHLTGDRDLGRDKIEQAAVESRKSAWEIASFYTDAFLKDLRELNILLPDKMPKATDHVKDMIKLIEKLEEKGFTYKTKDGVYFDTSKFPNYGKLANLDIEGLKEGARVEPNPEKKNPTDFALWKLSPPDKKRDMEWKSPWGVGFPGWHIECSAMSTKYLGQPFDIHTGGIDLIPVHHTNEIAQSESAFGLPLAAFWLHSEYVLINGGKMAKSEGGFITLDELVNKGYSPLAYRFFVIQGHYRSKLNFSIDAMESAQNSLNSLHANLAEFKTEGKTGCAELEKEFYEAINDDLDTPRALAAMWQTINSDFPPEEKLKSVFEYDKVFGLSLRDAWQELQKPIPEEVDELVTRREEMRKASDWYEADQLRVQIEEAGYLVKDTESGPIVKKKL
ncbi:cysteine--tRNA ligase [bacterium]|nr:MAG: cysteine--tRNA ligase [bacterium]